MQKCESRTKRVMSAIIAGMMALQVVAPTISYADDTVASTASSEDNSDTQHYMGRSKKSRFIYVQQCIGLLWLPSTHYKPV